MESTMTSREIRRRFLEFFGERGHRLVPSSPLVLPNDPTLLFANAGMNQFKDVFTGRDKREYSRAASVQKCLRVSGKHNDLEMVGRTPRHHTLFEMLGNFSFGDYFKDQAVEMAWALVTDVYGLPVDRLWVTVFGGTDAIPADDEAFAIWRDRVGVAERRILRLGENDNFWRMGDTGPCGPCSEIHFDLGQDLTSVAGESTPETDTRRFLEIWNLVFMQFDQRDAGTMVPLPAPCIDTGMGLERITAVVQGKRSNFETDLFVPLMEAAGGRAGVRVGQSEETDFSLRVIADHGRALCFLVADGVAPANDKRGYVLRRLLRRAIRHGRKLGIEGPFLDAVTPVVVEQLGDVYPELPGALEAILEIGRREEQRFAETLSTGLELLDAALGELEPNEGETPVLPGTELFRLYDTYGFPLDLARDIAEERGIRLDQDGFDAEMARQRSRAQASWKGAARGEEPHEIYVELARDHPVPFEGYDRTRVDGVRIRAVLDEGRRVATLDNGREGEVVLESTPLYAESGGQVADHGWIVGPDGLATVTDVRRPVDGLAVHRVRVEKGSLAEGDLATAEVDVAHRSAVRRNHTATHLLHAALREVVGTHVKQAGSLVAPDRLRFDFSHFHGLSDETLADIESLVNEKVLEDLPVESRTMALEDALRTGAMALFGEKYGDQVRVVTIGDFSRELCGGTHTERSGQIGLVKLTGERGIASGTRRIEAVSGQGSLDRFRQDQAIVRALEDSLSAPRDKLVEEIDRRLAQLRALQRDLERQRVGSVRDRLARQATDPPRAGGVALLAERVDGLSPQEMRELADGLRQKLGSGVVVLGRSEGGKASLLVMVSPNLADRLSAVDIVRDLGRIIGGGGGGRPELAEAGGKLGDKIDEALGAAAAAVERRVGGSG